MTIVYRTSVIWSVCQFVSVTRSVDVDAASTASEQASPCRCQHVPSPELMLRYGHTIRT